jgi:hypothetical protein
MGEDMEKEQSEKRKKRYKGYGKRNAVFSVLTREYGLIFCS